jgi:LemA protein
MATFYVFAAIVAVVVLWAILTYNGLVGLRNRVRESWSGIDVQLKRRHDLVPNLVETVKGYAAHEREVLGEVTTARAAAMSATGPGDQSRAESGLSAALQGIRAVAEAYPQLRAAENFQRLQGQLAEVEDEIQAARRIYNSNVQRFNTRIETFPSSIVAGAGHFEKREFFEIEVPAERAVPVVSFS